MYFEQRYSLLRFLKFPAECFVFMFCHFEILPMLFTGAPLVKGIPFDPTDAEISGPDIFQKLVPMEAHEAASVYR